jgi:hypothetical protein
MPAIVLSRNLYYSTLDDRRSESQLHAGALFAFATHGCPVTYADRGKLREVTVPGGPPAA